MLLCMNNYLNNIYFWVEAQENSDRSEHQEMELSKDELNALRYACGYVAVKLLKKYEKKKDLGKKSEQFEMCLGNMAVTGEETNLTAYTTEWFDKVNRGGLFPLNDETFTFLVAVEMVTRKILPMQYNTKRQENIKQQRDNTT